MPDHAITRDLLALGIAEAALIEDHGITDMAEAARLAPRYAQHARCALARLLAAHPDLAAVLP